MTPHQHYNSLKKAYKIGGCTLSIRNRKVYLTIAFNRDQVLSKDNAKYLGVDLGIKNIATISNGSEINKIYKAAKVAASKGKYKKIKSSLQTAKAQKLSRSLRRKETSFRRKERNFVRNSNHIISKDIVRTAKLNGITVIKMEDLSGIREQDCSKDYRKALHGWSYYELQTFIEYKANAFGISVRYIDPSYTSQTCSKCGIVDPLSRKGLNFKCVEKLCNYRLHADLNAAKNISRSEEAEKPKWIAKSAKKVKAPRKAKPLASVLTDAKSTG